ncbi:MAG TPA: hypothetical protein DIU15_05455 [Deltaproteobacteria bacterium]|nr:hypothetical protein [Deltaproteobacteria bacterium]HCP45465.1 hypothetical protein [Deltaproteobacteria bacterium]
MALCFVVESRCGTDAKIMCMTRRILWLVCSVLVTHGLAGCEQQTLLTAEQLLNPDACQSCHPDHYQEWSGSMHAYASEDPVFRAMNARGQEETDGELGDFCVQCHAPMAVAQGVTEDGLNLDELDAPMQGVTCAFCHLANEVEGDHNAPIRLGTDGILLGGLADPVPTEAHKLAYSPLHDRNDLRSSTLCGSCHDIVTPRGVHLERTFAEWKESIFAQDTVFRLSCGNCHTRGRDGQAADLEGLPIRRLHDHRMAGVDVALTPFPDADNQRLDVQRELDSTLASTICVAPFAGGSEVVVRLDNVGAGHSWPSGAAHDRRGWIEVTAWRGDEVLFQSGHVEEGVPITSIEDPYLFLLRDKGFDENGEEAHMFWDIASVESNLLGTSVTLDPSDPAYYHYQEARYPILGAVPDRVTSRVRLRPMGLEVIDDLIESGHLDPSIRANFPTFDLESTVLVWEGDVGDCVGP